MNQQNEEKVFRKVSVKDNRHSPIYDTWYFVFTEDGKETQAFHTAEGWNWDDIKFSSVPKDYITHWLEELPLSELTPKEQETELPSKEQIDAKAKDEFNYYENNYVQENTAEENRIMKANEIRNRSVFWMGADWMKSLASPIISKLKEESRIANENFHARCSVIDELLSNAEVKDKELSAIRSAEKGILEKLLSTDGQLQDCKRELADLKYQKLK